MQNYYKFDVKAYLMDYKRNKEEYEKLCEEYKDILTSMGLDYSKERVTSSNIASEVENKAIQRERFEKRLKPYRWYFKGIAKLIEGSSADENYIYELYMHNIPNKTKAIQKHFNLNSSKAHRLKEATLDRVEYIIK